MSDPRCKELLAQGLSESSAIDVHSAIRSTLEMTLNRKLNQLKESDDQRNAALEIKMAAKSFSGEDADDHNGVIIVYFKSKQGATDFADYLENQETVETYEINTLPQVHTGSNQPNVIELEFMTDDHQNNFQVIAYLYPEYTTFDSDYDGDGDEDENDDEMVAGLDDEDFAESINHTPGEPINEVLRKIRINARGVKSIKMKCGQGFKWDPSLKACVKITGQQLSIMRKSSRKALITKKAMGSSFKVRVKRRILKAFKFRKMMGLKV